MLDGSTLLEAVRSGGVLHLGFATVALAYLFRDILHLRLLAVAGYGLFIVHTVSQGTTTALTAAAWYTLFLLVNAVQAALLAYQRRCESLTAEERRLAGGAFASIDVGAARRMMRRGTWKTLAPGAVLSEEGEKGKALYAILYGRVAIEARGETVAEAGPGEFIGEIGFLSRGPATATAVAAEPVRALVWDRNELEQAIRRAPELHATAHAAFGSDLARKVAQQSLGPRRHVAEVERDARGGSEQAIER